MPAADCYHAALRKAARQSRLARKLPRPFSHSEQALGTAMATAVRSGAAGHAAAVAAELLHEGHQELLADVAAHLAGTGAAGGLSACTAKACKFEQAKLEGEQRLTTCRRSSALQHWVQATPLS